MGLPALLTERLFFIMDKDKNEFLSLSEFIQGLSKLFSKDFERNVSLVFDLFDFDEDGFAISEDLRVVLSHVPVTEILSPHSLTAPKEGKFTQAGGGL